MTSPSLMVLIGRSQFLDVKAAMMKTVTMMTTLLYRLGALLFLLFSLSPSITSGNRLIRTEKGTLRGTETVVNGKTIDMYLGIPFAEPPVGDLRFKHPTPNKPWTGILNATKHANTCMQGEDNTFGNFTGSQMWNPNTPVSEDCLYLSVWAPRTKTPRRNLAVLVWIFGGGFYSGTYTLDVYDPKYLVAEHDIIYVTMQYRVGSLGFLAFGHPEAPGNAGLFDQLLALSWIQENIHHFGGDPRNVTLFGESAGAVSVSMHLLSPLSRGKFSRAIMESGSANMDWATYSSKEAMLRGLQLADLMDCKVSSDIKEIVDCLRQAPAEHFKDMEWVTTGPMQFPFVPIVDGTFFTERPQKSLEDKNFKHCPVLLGSNSDEGSYFTIYELPQYLNLTERGALTQEQFSNAVNNLFYFYPQFRTTINKFGLEAIKFQYTHWLNPDDAYKHLDAVNDAIGDWHFLCQVNEFADSYVEAGQDVYYYFFSHRSSQNPWPRWMGVMHADEVNYVFGEPLNPALKYSEKERELSKQIMEYWVNFAKTGNPNHFPSGEIKSDWPKRTVRNKEYLELNTKYLYDKQRAVGRGPRAKHCAFWEHYLPKLVVDTQDIHEAERQWKEQFHEWSTRYIVDWKHQYDQYMTAQNMKCGGEGGET
ncbi:acetylcholinesterase isoform X2 [Lingula anatina]|uniref:Carboxylic ester hydrolase n=1 Tax=Lingula anatina TaxID=7574 RepID=A0A1S3JFI7_LINAN|nr:acetylcholinesterase isoform X2 [Lingula anatina]|eukprot:XP_013408916.1 acetylcholinesterase isoform X2 [Lingula anatina]